MNLCINLELIKSDKITIEPEVIEHWIWLTVTSAFVNILCGRMLESDSASFRPVRRRSVSAEDMQK